MITSPTNATLTLVRKLALKKHRDALGLFLAEGEDLVEAAALHGWAPEHLLRAGEDVEPELLAAASSLGSGTRVLGVYRRRWSEPGGELSVYLHGVGDPGNVGAVIRSAHALTAGTIVLGPGCADPHGPKAVRATMGSIFGIPLARAAVESTPRPRVALVAHGGDAPTRRGVPLTVCLGAERDGLPAEVLDACEARWTIPLRAGGAESLNVAAAAAIVLQRVSSAAAEGAA